MITVDNVLTEYQQLIPGREHEELFLLSVYLPDKREHRIRINSELHGS